MSKLFKKEKWNYALYGALFGFLFPLGSSLAQCFLSRDSFSLVCLLQIQQETPLLWVIDTAPFFLGIFAMYTGIQIDKLNSANELLKNRVDEQDEELKSEYQREKQLVNEKTDALLEVEHTRQQLENDNNSHSL